MEALISLCFRMLLQSTPTQGPDHGSSPYQGHAFCPLLPGHPVPKLSLKDLSPSPQQNPEIFPSSFYSSSISHQDKKDLSSSSESLFIKENDHSVEKQPYRIWKQWWKSTFQKKTMHFTISRNPENSENTHIYHLSEKHQIWQFFRYLSFFTFFIFPTFPIFHIFSYFTYFSYGSGIAVFYQFPKIPYFPQKPYFSQIPHFWPFPQKPQNWPFSHLPPKTLFSPKYPKTPKYPIFQNTPFTPILAILGGWPFYLPQRLSLENIFQKTPGSTSIQFFKFQSISMDL